MTIFKNKEDNKLYVVNKGGVTISSGENYTITHYPLNSIYGGREISQEYFNKYLVVVGER